jgi:CarboxypepD_reg-like domain
MKNIILVILILLVSKVSAQIVISGNVSDSKTKKNIADVSVYVNNTTIATLTDKNGFYKVYIPTGDKLELVFSHINYQKKSINIDAGASTDINVQLNVKNNTLNEVVIKAKKNSKASVRNWLDLFTKNLIGNYPNVSLRCKIINPEDLYFDYDRSNGQLQVFAKRQIIVENVSLGYIIKVDLDQFSYNFRTNEIIFKYSVFFNEQVQANQKIALIQKNRLGLYLGSNMHFMRSLYQDSLQKNGFSVYKFSSISNLERNRVVKAIQEKIESAYANQLNPSTDLSRLFTSADTVFYYKNILAQQPYISFDTIRLNRTNYSKANYNYKVVNFFSKDTLMIVYNGPNPKRLNESEFFTRFDPRGSVYRKYEKQTKQYLSWNSYAVFFNKGVNIKPNGYYPDMGIYIYGDIGERRLAGMLPFDYYPSKVL